jgi:hypothetical protein
VKPVRMLAWFAIVAQFVFIGAWITAGALEDGYSHAHDYISELGADGAGHPWIVNAAILLLGLSMAAVAFALWRTLPHRRASRVAVALFVVAALSFVLAAIFNGDCSTAVDATCQARYDEWDVSTSAQIHGWAAFVGGLCLVGTAFALARALWNQPVAAPLLVSGLIGLGFAVVGPFAESIDNGPDGLVQRVEFGALHIWIIEIAIGVLWATRGQPKLPPPTPMRPSEFFGSTWVGDGELVPWPYFFWRRFPQRLRIRRETTFLSDETWYFDDTISRLDGPVMDTRRIFCTLVAPDRVEVVADELLDRTYIVLEEDGYRIAPYRVAIRVGPVHFGVSVRDSATVENGTLVNRFRASWFGLPVARIEVRVRPESEPAASEAAATCSRASS